MEGFPRIVLKSICEVFDLISRELFKPGIDQRLLQVFGAIFNFFFLCFSNSCPVYYFNILPVGLKILFLPFFLASTGCTQTKVFSLIQMSAYSQFMLGTTNGRHRGTTNDRLEEGRSQPRVGRSPNKTANEMTESSHSKRARREREEREG